MEPSGLSHPYYTLTLHAFIWHLTLVFIGFYLGFSRRAGTTRRGATDSMVLLLISAGVAQLFNVLLHPLGEINMFFISPFATSPIAVFSEISARYGWIINTPLYLLCLMIAGTLFYLMFYFINGLRSERRKQTLPPY